MNIIGLNFRFHDSSAALVANGKLIAAIEEERFIRRKHTWEFPEKSIDKCLDIAGITYDEIDYIAIAFKLWHKWFSRIFYAFCHLRHAKPFLLKEFGGAIIKQRNFWKWYKSHWSDKKKGPSVVYIQHHLAHIAGSFFVSPYENAALLSIDGSGEWATSWLGEGCGNTYRCFSQSYFPMSLGSFYSTVTQFCGFRTDYDEGKTMGLAAWGDPSKYAKTVDKMVDIKSGGVIKLDLSYFSYQFWEGRFCSDKFISIFGNPRDPASGKENFNKQHMDVAAAFQETLESKVLELCAFLRKKTDAKYLVIAGGVGLNSVVNGRIIRESGFKDIYIMPGAGDNGTAIGAAFYLYNGILKKPRTFVHNDPYLGPEYSDEVIERIIKESKLKSIKPEDIISKTAKLLHEGKIIGWFQGRMEFGPRALGNRSILANPILQGMKEKINAEVKHRESFRPFAPAVPRECAGEYFDINVEAPFMLKVCYVQPEKRELLPAITHVDNTARLQTVDKEVNKRFHDLLTEFGRISGIPVLLNTSFNIMGEPIVESPYDAIRCFFSTGLDCLVIGKHLITK